MMTMPAVRACRLPMRHALTTDGRHMHPSYHSLGALRAVREAEALHDAFHDARYGVRIEFRDALVWRIVVDI